MAGIGFELKKLFNRRGILATIRAYGYAGMVCAGPMILGVALLIGIMFLANVYGATRFERELLISMITYTLLASLTVTSVFSMVTTRYTADMLFNNEKQRITPSFLGSISIMLVFGGICYAIFLAFSGVIIEYKFLSFIFFMTLIVTWTEINYLTAIKDYRNIMKAFTVALLATFLIGYLLLAFSTIPIITSLFISACCGYGIMSVWYFILIYIDFPEGFGTSVDFFKWVDKYPYLVGVGFFITLGLFGHLVIIWSSQIGEQIKGLFYGAPEYDVSALVAFFSILVTTVNFITSVEVKFYPQYRNYFSLFNEGGSIGDIEASEKSMLQILKDEISYLAQKQVFATILFIVVGSLLLPRLQLGFNADMLGMFRVLCVGYAFYAIANSVMLISLYFADNKGAFYSTLVFAVTTNLLTLISKFFSTAFYGFGFVIGSATFCIIAFIRLDKYVEKLKYHVVAEQPIFEKQSDGWLTHFAERQEKKAKRKQRFRKEFYERKTEGKANDKLAKF